MKVLVITSLFPNCKQPRLGLFIRERIKALAKYCDIKVIAPVPYFPPINIRKKWFLYSQIPKKEIQAGLEVYHPRWFIVPKIGMSFYGVFYFLSILSYIKNIQKEFDFDIIDAHFLYPDGFAAILIAKVLNKPVVVSGRGKDASYNGYLRSPIIRTLIIAALKCADRIITVAASLKNELVRFNIPENKIVVIPNGVDNKKFYPIDKYKARKELNLPYDKKILLSCGFLVKRKGFQFLIDAVDVLIKRNIKDIILIIIGEPNPEGNFYNELNTQINRLKINDNVKLVGAKSHEELYKWYSAADLFCLATLQEGCPNVVWESLACGLPAVCSNVDGIPQIISSAEYGILVDSWDKVKWAETILQALNIQWNKEKIIQYSHKNTWDNIAKKIMKEFTYILKGIEK
jgi:glycosyltransferase involved in cell wall biosynthesis